MLEVGLFLVMLVLVLGVLGLIVWNGKRVERRRESVKPSEADAPVVMSRPQEEVPQNTPSSLRQTTPQTDRQPSAPQFPRDVMLDIYRLLRSHNVPREKARPILKAAGIPLDNNLWTEAQVSVDEEDDTCVTPIAGRPTKASYYDDPTLEYQPPPR